VAAPKVLKSGVRLQAGEDGEGWYIRLKGKAVDRETIEAALLELEKLFGPPPSER
jgi:ParB family chromosome partitioning protein